MYNAAVKHLKASYVILLSLCLLIPPPLAFSQPPICRHNFSVCERRGFVQTPQESNLHPTLQGPSQKRADVVGVEARKTTRTYVRKGKDFALLIGVDVYDNWPRLNNPVRDVHAIAEALRDYYGFETEVVENPTKKELRDAILRYKREKKYADDDQLLIFFAGHGAFLEEWQRGHIVAKDSKPIKDDDTGDSYLSHQWLKDTIDLINCKHIFLILDSCFSGTIDDVVARRGGDNEYSDAANPAFIERNMRYPTRKYLTSGGKEYVPDGRPGQHSPFTRKLLDALRKGGGQDGILSFTGILSYMERVTPEPRHNGWGKDEPGSNFLFIAKAK